MDYFQLSAGALAYLGDAVLEALVREALILKGLENPHILTRKLLTMLLLLINVRLLLTLKHT